MKKASIDSIETFGLVDGPGIRTVVFFNGCNLRCKFCHNPEMWGMKDKTVSVDELFNKILRNKPYFNHDGGVTFSGGEPLLHIDFLEELCDKLKEEDIHITLDTAGIGLGNYKSILSKVDLVLLDIKGINKEGFIDITQVDLFDKFMEFVHELNESNVDVWIRQVVIPGVNDTEEYMSNLSEFIKENIKNVKRVDFLPFHKMGDEKYLKLGIKNPYEDKDAMDKDKCDKLYEMFIKDFK
jgi:pyruvate formate lyase activating enzyme